MKSPSPSPVEQEGFYKSLMLNSPVAIAFLDMKGSVIACNPAFEQLFGYCEAEILGRHVDTLVSDDEIKLEASNYTRRVLDLGETIRVSGRRRKKDGSYLDVDMQGVPVIIQGDTRGVLVLYNDITASKKTEQNLQAFYSSLTLILDSLDADIYVADMDSYEILFMNKHMRDSFGGDFAGQICYKVFRQESQPCGHCSNPKLIDAQGNPTGVYVWEGRNPITERWYKNSDRVISWEGGRYVRLQIATDITDLKEAESRLEHMATHDALTGLPNRILFHDRLSHALDIARRTRTLLAVLFLDLDRFKQVNDEHGHLCGDELLISVAERLCSAVRDCDTSARVSGDEFAIILEELQDSDTAGMVAKRVLSALAQTYKISDCKLSITVSIGIALFPEDADSPDRLVLLADEAMYTAKTDGRNSVVRTEKRRRSDQD